MDRFSEAHFHDENAARAYLEALLWPDGPVCPHCGVIGHAYARKRPGLYRCAEPTCRKDFTVTMKTVMERSKIALHKWLQAFHLMCSSKKGVSAHQIHRTMDITYEAAWFMCHRIREAMRDGGLKLIGGNGQIVEADETYFGPTEKPRISKQRKGRPYKVGSRGPRDKRPIVALVERGGNVRTFHVAQRRQGDGRQYRNCKRRARAACTQMKAACMAIWLQHFAAHETVKHSAGEYVRGDVYTNTAEGYFSVFKRGMRGVYQHCKEKHLHRYLSEYDFRFNHRTALGFNDGERAALAVKNAAGKRLTYRQPH